MDPAGTTLSTIVKGSSNNVTVDYDYEELDWTSYDQAAALLSFTLFVFIFILNGAVLFALCCREHKKSRLHFFIFHLAIADMLVGFVNVLGDGVESSLYGVWYGGDVPCRIWRYLKSVVIIASNNLLIGMSLDRFLAVRVPMKFVKIGNKLDKCLVAGAWIFSISLSVFIIPFSKGTTGKSCDMTFPASWWKPYFLTVAGVVYIMPAVVITACYTGICYVVWSKWRKGLQLSEMNKEKSPYEKLQGCKHNKNSGLLPKAKVKSIKMTLVVCSAFFLCWTPYFVFSILDIYGYNTIDPRVYMLLGMLYPLNSACNPLIFIIFNTRMFLPRKLTQHTMTGISYDGASTQISTG